MRRRERTKVHFNKFHNIVEKIDEIDATINRGFRGMEDQREWEK